MWVENGPEIDVLKLVFKKIGEILVDCSADRQGGGLVAKFNAMEEIIFIESYAGDIGFALAEFMRQILHDRGLTPRFTYSYKDRVFTTQSFSEGP